MSEESLLKQISDTYLKNSRLEKKIRYLLITIVIALLAQFPEIVTKQQGANWDIGAYVH